jgi:beta-glucosidase
VGAGLLTEYEIDRALGRLLQARFRLGMFDPPERVPWASIPYEMNDSGPHAALAEEAARASIVLLENDGILPLPDDLDVLAVVGPNADAADVLLGNYNGLPSAPVTPLEGIRRRVSEHTRVVYAQGCEIAPGLPLMVPVPADVLMSDAEGRQRGGLRAAWYDSLGFRGEPVRTGPDGPVDHNWWDDGPGEGIDHDAFSVVWSGALVAPATGEYTLGLQGMGIYRLFLDGEQLLAYRDRHLPWTETRTVRLEAGQTYPLRIEYESIPERDAVLRLLWAPPRPDLRSEALTAAAEADVVVLVLGLTPRLEGEEMPVPVPGFAGGDRLDLRLPEPQRDLLAAVTALGRPTVLVLLSGSALAVGEEAAAVQAVLQTWYPGQAGGTALAQVLFGDLNPSGRLPVTFYRSVDDLPPFDDYRMAGRTYRYFDGAVLYPFGHGLSYTQFEYSDLQLPRRVHAGRAVEVAVTVRNAGERDGWEVVQLYLSDPESSAPVPRCSLQGFRRIFLHAGESHRLYFDLHARQLSLITADGERVVEPGSFEVSVGGGQPGVPGVASVNGWFEVTGQPWTTPHR